MFYVLDDKAIKYRESGHWVRVRSGHERRISLARRGFEKVAYGPFPTEESARHWMKLKGPAGKISSELPKKYRLITVAKEA
jgi:hypothetical protein